MSKFIEVTPVDDGVKSEYAEFVNVDKIISISDFGLDGGRSTLWFSETNSMEIAETASSVLLLIEDD